MFHSMFRSAPAALAVALAASVTLSGCGTMATNNSLESVNQPVVTRTNYTFDAMSGPAGLAPNEQRRLAGWFDAMNLRYGDRISIDDPQSSGATRSSVETVAARYGLLVTDDAPATSGYVQNGSVRVVVTRATAMVPHCPDWATQSESNLKNGTASGYGCAINGNLAAMVANPEHLVHGASGDSMTTVMSSTKAIDSYRDAKPTGEGGLKQTSSKATGN